MESPDGVDLSTSGLVYLFADRLLPEAFWSYGNLRARLPSGVLVDNAELSALLLTVAVLGLRDRGLVALEQQGPWVLVRLTTPLELPRRWRRGRRIPGRVYPSDTVEDLVLELLARQLASLSDRNQLPPEEMVAVADGWYRPPPVIAVSWGAALKGLLFVDGWCQGETRRAGLTHLRGRWFVKAQDRTEIEARFSAWLAQWERLSGSEAELVEQLRRIAGLMLRQAAADLDA